MLAALPYLLPLLDALPYGEQLLQVHSLPACLNKSSQLTVNHAFMLVTGRYIFLDYPYVARAMAPLGPLAMLYNGIPFAP